MKTAVIDLDGPVNYADYGGDGEPLVVVHGIGGSHLNCSRLALELTDRFHVFAIDLLGFGFTPLAGRASTMETNQLLVSDFMVQVTGAPATVVGHSMGGVLAMLLAAGDPPAVKRLVLLNPSVGPLHSPVARVSTGLLNMMSRRPRLFAPVLRAGVRSDTKGSVRASLAKYVRDLDDYDPFLVQAHVDLERERSKTPGAYLGYLQAWRSMEEEAGDIQEFNRMVVNDIQAPTLLIQGAEDAIVPGVFAQTAHAIRPDWIVVELPNIGHVPHMERPERTAEMILEWVSSAGRAATPR
jgi:pimeloyl-ACP methyl ester carboxylesterase